MKSLKFLSTLMLLAGASMQANAQYHLLFQKQDPEQAQLLKAAKYGKVVVLQSKDATEPSPIGAFFYDAEGRLVREATTVRRETITYNAAGEITDYVDSTGSMDKPRVMAYSIRFDEYHKPSTMTIGEQTSTFTYLAADGMVTEVRTGKDGNTIAHFSYWYNEDGKVKEWMRMNAQKDTLEWHKTNFNTFGDPFVEVDMKYNLAQKSMDSTLTVYTRNAAGMILEKSVTVFKITQGTPEEIGSTKSIMSRTKWKMTYNFKKQLTETAKYDAQPEEPVLLETETIEYEPTGLPKEKTVRLANGATTLREKYSYFLLR